MSTATIHFDPLNSAINELFSLNETTPPPSQEQLDKVVHEFRHLTKDQQLTLFSQLRIRSVRTDRDGMTLAAILFRFGGHLKCQQGETFSVLESLFEWRHAGQMFGQQMVRCLRELTFTTR